MQVVETGMIRKRFIKIIGFGILLSARVGFYSHLGRLAQRDFEVVGVAFRNAPKGLFSVDLRHAGEITERTDRLRSFSPTRYGIYEVKKYSSAPTTD
jgi:hypothetical protein